MDGNKVSASRQIFDRLITLTTALGLQQEEVWQSETDSDLNIERDVPVNQVSKFPLELLNLVVSDWSDDFNLTISSKAGIRDFEASSSKPCDQKKLSTLFDDIDKSPTAVLQLRLQINKQHFLERHCSRPEKHVLYIFTRNFSRALQGAPAELQKIFFPVPFLQCHCVLLEQQVAIIGRHFFAHHDLEAIPAALPDRLWQQQKERIEVIQNLKSDYTRWIDFDTYLTPMHFAIEQNQPGASGLESLISQLQYTFIIFYLAESVRTVNGGRLAVFPGPTRTELLIPKPYTIKPVDNSVLYRIFRWCYSERTMDKLDIVRSTVSSVLGDDKSQNYDLLAAHGERIWNASRSTYVTLVRDAVAKHFDKLKQVQDYITVISTDLGNKVASIVSSLTTNTLAAIGVVLGAVVAYVFDNAHKLPRGAFKLGLVVYGAYIIVFPLCYSLLLNSLVDYTIMNNEFARRLQAFQDVLRLPTFFATAGAVVKTRSRHFWTVFTISGIVYLALALTCFAFGYYLPSK